MPSYPETHYSRMQLDKLAWPPRSTAIEVETCVVGGGLAGLATALSLAERGRTIAVLEAKRVGWGASGRNGGIASRGYPLSMDALATRVGKDHAMELWRLSSDALANVKGRAQQMEPSASLPDGVLRCRMVSHADTLPAYVDRMNLRYDAGLVHVPRAALRELLDSECYEDAYLNPSSLQLNPLEFTRSMAREAASRGARLHEGTRVTTLKKAKSEWRLVANGMTVRARNVVLTGGAYLGELHRRLVLATVPVATFVMATKPAPDRIKSSINTTCAVLDTRVATNYYRRLADGRLLWGGRASGIEWRPQMLADLLYRDMVRIHPRLAGLEVDVAWSGLMPIARHRMPVIRPLGDGLWAASCFAGLGLVTTTLAGELIGAAIAEGDDRIRLFEPFGLPFAGGSFGRVGFQITYWKLKTHDWVLAKKRSHQQKRAAA